MGLSQTFGNICNICRRVRGALCIRRKPIYFARLQRTPAESRERNGSLKKSQECIPRRFWALGELASLGGWLFHKLLVDISTKLLFLADQICCLKYPPFALHWWVTTNVWSIPENLPNMSSVLVHVRFIQPHNEVVCSSKQHTKKDACYHFLFWQKVRIR